MAGPRSSRATHDSIVYEFWLVFDARGNMRLTRTKGTIDRDERAMFLTATLPKSLFTRPELRGTITICPDTSKPIINVAAAGDALKKVLGFDIDLKVNEAGP
ncbi:hypothetical protein [Terrarubrum flagellatum]|uniref:hypothetical protein n=1 Tax=Terrirubrum flagellatum TaxID=2895980 RepID=UPI00314537B5